MENVYNTFINGKSKYGLGRSNSVPLFNTYNGQTKPIVSPDILKMQMMEERLKHLERQKREQNDQINALMSYQMNQNRINNNYNPNGLVLSANNILPPIGYRLTNIKQQNGGLITPIEKKYYIYPKTDKEFYKKEKKLKQYKKNISELKELLEQERMKRKMHRNLRNNVYNPIKRDITYLMDEMNYNFQKKLQNDNNIINENINEVQNNYDEMKYLLNNKMDKLELQQKMDFENLRNELMGTANQNEKEKQNIINELDRMDYDRNQLYETELQANLEEKLRNQRELDDLKHQKELDELRRRHEMEEMENKKMIEELRYKKMRNDLLNRRTRINPYLQIFPQPQPMIQHYPMPLMYPMPMPSYNNTTNNNGPADELFKLFMMKQLFGEEMFPQKKKRHTKYKYIYPPPSYDKHKDRHYYYSSSLSNITNSLKRRKFSKKSTHKKSSESKSVTKKSKKKSTKSKKSTKNKKKKKKKEKSEEEENEEEEDEEGEGEEGEGEDEEGEDKEGEDKEGGGEEGEEEEDKEGEEKEGEEKEGGEEGEDKEEEEGEEEE